VAEKKINWDEVFEKYTKNKILLRSYSEIAREIGVTEAAVRKQFKRRGVVDPRKDRTRSVRSSKVGSNLKNDSNSNDLKLHPIGNANALKHGLYAQVFWTERGKEIYRQLVESGEIPDPLFEIKLLQAKIASGEIHKLKDVLTALEIMSKLYDKVIAQARNDIERKRLEHEKERITIMREKLELEKTKQALGDEADITIEFGVSDDEETSDHNSNRS